MTACTQTSRVKKTMVYSNGNDMKNGYSDVRYIDLNNPIHGEFIISRKIYFPDRLYLLAIRFCVFYKCEELPGEKEQEKVWLM